MHKKYQELLFNLQLFKFKNISIYFLMTASKSRQFFIIYNVRFNVKLAI